MDDLRAVLDVTGVDRAVLFGTAEAAAMCMLFAATYPDRTLGLALFGPPSRTSWRGRVCGSRNAARRR
jgi:pimeloyl-ACP methyl ester carboxylesterase